MRFSAVSLVASATLLAGAVPARAGAIYKYVERDGTIVYTNVLPAGKKAKKVKGAFHRSPSASEPAAPAPASVPEYEQLIEAAAKRYRIPPSLVRAVMHAESNFDANAVSLRGASGLMQLMPDTAQEMYVRDIFDVRQNIEGGTRYLRVLANRYNGDMVKMLAAYNAGPEALEKFGGSVPPYEETQAYVRKVLQLYFQYKEQSQLAQAGPR
ncbi:MAG TPA: lytic transglycosylase domain-containing protein [Myxococcaceae bacterium]|nr:lytic transglycosylase domain-containing protein [Myxococcaceae bacterium]